METYEVPEDLVGKKNSEGEEIPSRIYPVFRDEEELGAGSDLTDRIYRALDNTRVLVVLCSPEVVKSPYVFAEISYFKRIGKVDAIYAAIIDGEPGARVIESGKCFPDSLQYEVGEDGTVHLDRSEEPLAADFRLPDGTEGWTSPEAYRQALVASDSNLSRKRADQLVSVYLQRLELAKLKLISGILKVPLGVLQKRDKAYQLKLAAIRARRLRRWLAAVLLLAVLAIAGGILTWIERGRTQQSFSNNLLDQGTELIAKGRPAEGFATVAGSLQMWPQNRIAADQIIIGASRRNFMLPMRFIPPPPSGTQAFPPQDIDRNIAYRNDEDRRYPYARFSKDFDGIEYYEPISEGALEADRYTFVFSESGYWGKSPSPVFPPPDGYSINGARIVSWQEFEVGGQINAFLKLKTPDGKYERMRFDVSNWTGGSPKEMHALGMAAVSGSQGYLGILGGLIDDSEDPSDTRTWKPLSEEISVFLIDPTTNKLLRSAWLAGYKNNFQKPQEGSDLHAVRFVGPYFVAHFSNFERPGWGTEIFDCSNPDDIVHVASNILLPGLIDDYNEATGEFLVRLPDGLVTFLLVEGPKLSEVFMDDILPAVEGVVETFYKADAPNHIRTESSDGKWAAEASRSGQVRILNRSRGDELVRTFSLQLDPTVEGGVALNRMLFLPNSSYLVFGMEVLSDAVCLWSGWDFLRGEEIFPPTYQRSEAEWKLVGASGDGDQLIFKKLGSDEPMTRILRLPPATLAAPAAKSLAELYSGIQWTENGLQPLNSEEFFRRRDELMSGKSNSPEMSYLLDQWRTRLLESLPKPVVE